MHKGTYAAEAKTLMDIHKTVPSIYLITHEKLTTQLCSKKL